MNKGETTIMYKLILILAAFTCLAMGPPGPPGGGGGNGPPGGPPGQPCWPAPCVPIDGGIAFLVVAALMYGGKKAYEIRKK